MLTVLPEEWSKIRDWCSWRKCRSEAVELGLTALVEAVESSQSEITDLPDLFERSFRRALLFSIIEGDTSLREFFGTEHDERIASLRELDERFTRLIRTLIRSRLAAGIPRNQGFNDVP